MPGAGAESPDGRRYAWRAYGSSSTASRCGAGSRASDRARRRRHVAADGATYLAPVEPTKIIATHLTYRSRGRGVRRAHAARAVVLHEAAVDAQRPPRRAAPAARRAASSTTRARWRSSSARRCTACRQDEVLDYVDGYAPANDVGLHDFRHADRGSMLRVKGQDGFCPIGPALTPADEFDPTDFTLRTYLNGEVVQEGGAGRPALADQLPARRPLPHDHARAGRRRPQRHAGQLAGRWSRATSSRSRSPAWAGCANTVVDWDVDLARPGRPARGLRQHAPRRAGHARGRGRARRGRRGSAHVIIDLRTHRPRLPARRRPRRGGRALGRPVRPAPSASAGDGRAYLALRLRAVLAWSSSRDDARRATTTRASSCAAHVTLADAARAPRAASASAYEERAGALHLADPDGNGIELHALPRARRPAARHRPPDHDAAGGFRPRKLGHVNSLTGDLRAPRRRSTPTCSACAVTDYLGDAGTWLHINADHHVMALVDKGRAHFHHLAFDFDDLGAARRGRSTTSPSTAAGWRGARCATASARTSAATCASPRRSASSSCYSTWSSSRSTTSRASGPTTATRPTPGGRCRPARTSASTPRPIESERESLETLGSPLAPLRRH